MRWENTTDNDDSQDLLQDSKRPHTYTLLHQSHSIQIFFQRRHFHHSMTSIGEKRENNGESEIKKTKEWKIKTYVSTGDLQVR